MNDLKFALRQLRKSTGFTLIAVLTLALGIRLNTSIFSLIDDLFLRPLPFKDPQRLVHIYSNARERNLLELAISVPRFQHFRESQAIFDSFGAENQCAFTLTGLGDAVQILGGQVTSNYFDVLGVQPIRVAGRDCTAGMPAPGSTRDTRQSGSSAARRVRTHNFFYQSIQPQLMD